MDCKEGFFKWFKLFVIWTVILLIAGFGFEYVVFNTVFFYKVIVAGFKVPAVIVYALLIGVAFSTAQFVLKPVPRAMPSPPAYRQQAARPVAKAVKKPAKRKRKK